MCRDESRSPGERHSEQEGEANAATSLRSPQHPPDLRDRTFSLATARAGQISPHSDSVMDLISSSVGLVSFSLFPTTPPYSTHIERVQA